MQLIPGYKHHNEMNGQSEKHHLQTLFYSHKSFKQRIQTIINVINVLQTKPITA